MPRYHPPLVRPPARAKILAVPSYAVIATAVLIMLGLGILVVRSGAIDALNASKLLGG